MKEYDIGDASNTPTFKIPAAFFHDPTSIVSGKYFITNTPNILLLLLPMSIHMKNNTNPIWLCFLWSVRYDNGT